MNVAAHQRVGEELPVRARQTRREAIENTRALGRKAEAELSVHESDDCVDERAGGAAAGVAWHRELVGRWGSEVACEMTRTEYRHWGPRHWGPAK